jgi:hypothetical protein
MKRYSIAHLLSKQPKSLKKNKHYRDMLYYYQTSPKLKKVRFSRRCYSLLLHAKIKPENLKHFYRTYRLPKDPFFPLYFAVKREYLAQKERRKREKTEYIAKKMRGLPPNVLSFIKFLAKYEKQCNHSGRCPVWNEHLFPNTKKRANEYQSFESVAWIAFFTDYLVLLSRRYRVMKEGDGEKLLACFILECLPELPPPSSLIPPAKEVVKNYRRLSKLHHPDQGGDAAMFVRLKWARDVVTG